MIFKKKKDRMIDLTQNQRKIPTPQPKPTTQTDTQGFVDPSQTSNKDFFGYTKKPQPQQTFTTETDGYNKREVDQKITELDNKIYKLEQRLELIEKKLNVNQNNNGGNLIGW